MEPQITASRALNICIWLWLINSCIWLWGAARQGIPWSTHITSYPWNTRQEATLYQWYKILWQRDVKNNCLWSPQKGHASWAWAQGSIKSLECFLTSPRICHRGGTAVEVRVVSGINEDCLCPPFQKCWLLIRKALFGFVCLFSCFACFFLWCCQFSDAKRGSWKETFCPK